ncbi:Hypothetical predicted protein [Pelobates cultripes]|uniref:Uncharacterized protein n=1 Tax=Pelobates cultripes TaxID=61616 RepID=A0AAD1RM18_PELCU|nr:Hypothetical predicted protein [Pelobates cultripes]
MNTSPQQLKLSHNHKTTPTPTPKNTTNSQASNDQHTQHKPTGCKKTHKRSAPPQPPTWQPRREVTQSYNLTTLPKPKHNHKALNKLDIKPIKTTHSLNNHKRTPQ